MGASAPISMGGYYDTHADAFVARTRDVDVSHLRQRFTAHLPAGGRVLDAGCGSGRDAKALSGLGFQVSAFDASLAMVHAARAHTGLDVQHSTFERYESNTPFDGVWACASLLHVPRPALPSTLEHLLGLLRPGGVLYASFKLGDHERTHDDRYFNDVTPASLTCVVTQLRHAELAELWETAGVQDPHQRWVNALVRRLA